MTTAASDWEQWSTSCRLVVTEPGTLSEARAIADEVMAGVEQACSRFRSDSEIRALHPGRQVVSPTLAWLLRIALDAAATTGGAVDPTVGNALSAQGYDRDIRLVQAGPVTVKVKPAAGWRQLRLVGRVLTLPDMIEIDLGATAKAAAADRCAAEIATTLGTGVLVSLGGDIATAGRSPHQSWQITVQDRPVDPAQQITLGAGAAVATSSTVKRVWNNGQVHHLIDPFTGTPSRSPWRSVSVVASDCVTANVATTATLVKGSAGFDWLRRTRLPARLLGHDGRVRTINGWPQEAAA